MPKAGQNDRVVKDMKRVLFFTHHLSMGGAEKCVRTIAEYFYQHKEIYQIDPYVAVVYDDPVVRKEMHQVLILEHHSETGDSRIKKAVNVLKQAGELRKIKKAYRIDTCVSFLPGADFLNCLSGAGERRVVSVRNKESLFTHSIWKKEYVLFSYRHSDLITTVSEAVREDVISFFGMNADKVCAIPNSAPQIPESRPVSDEFLDFTKGRMVFLNAGRLKPEKGQIHLLRAFAKLASVRQDVCLVILGEGPLREILEKEIHRLGLEKQVRLEGYRSNTADYMKAADFFVLSSNIEGMPNVIIEALQAGLPVISTECGAREILSPEKMSKEGASKQKPYSVLKGKYGILTPVCGRETTVDGVMSVCETTEISVEEELLSEAMKQMLIDKKLQERYRERTQEALKRFDLKEVAAQWAAAL